MDQIRTIAEIQERNTIHRRMDGYRAVFEKTDRIISGLPIRVAISRGNGIAAKAPGWSDGSTVYFNEAVLQSELARFRGRNLAPLVMNLKGINYHELSHILFTPRMGDDICKKVIEKAEEEGTADWWLAFNGLEDQRIETWFTASYRPATRYFESLVLKWIVSNQAQLPRAHPLVYGRKFLSAEVRHAAHKAFVAKFDKSLAKDFCMVIDAYLTVSYPADTLKAFRLVEEYKRLLDQVKALSGDPTVRGDCVVNCPNGRNNNQSTGDGEATIRKGKLSQSVNRTAKKAAEKAIEQAQDEDEAIQKADPITDSVKPEPGEPGKGDANDAGESNGEGDDGAGDGEGDGSGQGQGKGDPGETGDGESNSKSNDPTGGNTTGEGSGVSNDESESFTGNGTAAGLDELIDDAIDKAYDALEDALADPELQEDLKATADAIQAAQGEAGNVDGEVADFHEKPTPDPVRHSANRMIDVLRRLKTELEPTMHRRQLVGGVDLARYIRRQDHEVDFFRQWYEGDEESAQIEAVILVDMSASMYGCMTQASEALWVIKRSFDELEIRTTVIGFSDSHTVLYRPNEKSKRGTLRSFATYNSTCPQSAMREAYKLISRSKLPNRILLTITDGQWGGAVDQTELTVRAIQKHNCTTMILGLDQAVATFGKHNHQLSHDLDDIREMPMVALKLVSTIMRRVMASR